VIRKVADIQIGIVSAPVFPILALVHEQESLFPVNLQLYFLKIFSKRNRAVLIRKVTEGFIIKAYSTLDGAFSSGKQFSNVRFFSQQGGCETQPYAIVFSLLLFCAVLPSSIVSCCVKYGEDHDCIGPHNEENAIRKPSRENTTNCWISANMCKGLRIP